MTDTESAEGWFEGALIVVNTERDGADEDHQYSRCDYQDARPVMMDGAEGMAMNLTRELHNAYYILCVAKDEKTTRVTGVFSCRAISHVARTRSSIQER